MSEPVLKIAQLSDSHLPKNPAAPYRGENADENLARVWEKAKAWGPDLLLLTGDLSEDASEASYDRMAALLGTEVPILALPGNHDVGAVMRKRFPEGPWAGPCLHEAGNWLIVLTDSTLPGRVEGGFSAEEIDQLRNAMAASSQEHILLALHHQPVPVSAPWIDRYALRDPEAFLELVDKEPRVRCVLWGHIHHHFAEDRSGVLMLGAPSTAANSVARSDRFEADPAGPACRRIELESNGGVAYGQLFANAG